LVAFAVGGMEAHSIPARMVLQLAYHGGRLVTYALVGAVCGLLGAALDLGGSLVGLHRAAAVLAGGTMIGVRDHQRPAISGLALAEHSGAGRSAAAPGVWPAAGHRLAALASCADHRIVDGLLPCGWLWAFALIAAGTGNAGWGAAVMIAFWAGTVPVLASVGAAVQTLTGTLGRRLPLITALLLVAMGLGTIAERFVLSGEPLVAPLPAHGPIDLEQQIEAVRQTPPPCCQDLFQCFPPVGGKRDDTVQFGQVGFQQLAIRLIVVHD
jgi:uncharacterized protein